MSRNPERCTGTTSEEVEENANESAPTSKKQKRDRKQKDRVDPPRDEDIDDVEEESAPASKKQKRDRKQKDRVDASRDEDIDDPRDEEESTFTNSSSLSSTTSIPPFFQQIPLTNRRPTVDEAFGMSPQFTCKGRTDQLSKILRSIVSDWSPSEKHKAYYFHASPGVGKTFLLKQLFKRNFPQEYKGWKDKFFFLVADFNRNACIQAEPFKDHFRTQSEQFILLRIFYVEFVDQKKCLWKNFLTIFFEFTTTSLLKIEAMEYIVEQLGKRITKSGCTKVVLLVDEILKTKDLGEDFSRSCRSALCSYLDGLNPLYHEIIFSSLSVGFMAEENPCSGRPMNLICTLPLLTLKDTYALLKTYIKCEFSKQEGNPDEEIRSDCLRQLAVICGGHGRSIEYVVNRTKVPYKVSLREVIQEAANDLMGAYSNINVNLILKAILLGESVGIGDMIGGETCGSLVSRGVFVDSFTSNSQETFIPRCPELFLYAWVIETTLDQNLRDHLKPILDFRDSFTYKSFETLHSLWEQLIRCVRTDIKYKTMPLREVYRIDHRDLKVKHNPNCTENATKCPVDAQFELKVLPYKSRTTVEVALNTILIPKSENNAGWDRLIFYEAFPTGSATSNKTKKRYVLPVFIQNKWSKKGAATKLRIRTVKAAVGHCQKFLDTSCSFTNCQLIPRESIKFRLGFSNSPFIVIILTRQNSNKNALTLAPTNVMFCFEEELNLLYGPTLASFVKYLIPDESHYVTQPTQNLTVASSSSSSSSTITPSTSSTITPSRTTTTVSNPPPTEEKE